MFNQIQIQTRTGCNLKCPMCPNSKIKQPFKLMKMSLFEKIIDELSEIGFDGRVSLYLMNEPFLDKRLPALVKYARKKLPNNRINISTNGTLVKEIDLPGLSDCDVSCYTEEALKYWKKKDVNAINMVDHKYKYDNRGGNIDVDNGEIGEYCERPFIQMYINARGQSILCCSDYKFEVVMGDVNDNTLMEIWNGNKYEEYRSKLKEGDRKSLALCNKCNYP